MVVAPAPELELVPEPEPLLVELPASAENFCASEAGKVAVADAPTPATAGVGWPIAVEATALAADWKASKEVLVPLSALIALCARG